MPTFPLEERDLAWVDRAPVLITKTFTLGGTRRRGLRPVGRPAGLVRVVRGHEGVRIDGAASGVGALRTVWVGATRVQERFVVWDPGQPPDVHPDRVEHPGPALHGRGLGHGPRPRGPRPRTILTVRVGIEAAGLLRPFPGLVRAIMSGPLKGAAGITTQFPRP